MVGASDGLAMIAGQLISGATAVGIGAAVSGGSTAGAAMGLNVDANNRQLHPSEQKKAKELYELAKKQGLPYTLADIEDALRWADNKDLNETRFSNIVVLLNAGTQAGQIFDAASMSFSPNGGNPVLYQDMSRIAIPDAGLMAYIQQQTGSTYQWDTSVWNTAAPTPTPANNTRYTVVAVPKADGKEGKDYLRIPLADCPAAGCTNGSPIAWASTNPEDQKALAAYTAALDQAAQRAAAYGAGPLVMMGGAALGGIPVASQVIMGAGIGGGVNAATQYQLNGGDVNGSEVIMGAVTGGLTMGRNLIPTVLINTSGAMVTSAYENQNIGASMAGAAAGSVAGWHIGNWTEHFTGHILQRATTGFTDAWVSQPFAISTPVPGSTLPARVGATIGAGTQEVLGDLVKNKLKELP